MKKRLLQICIVIAGLLLGLRAAALHDGKEPFVVKTAAHRLIPYVGERQEMISSEPYALYDFSGTAGDVLLPEDLLSELQDYVVKGEYESALEAYRDESIEVSWRVFWEVCPEYKDMLAEWLAEHEEEAWRFEGKSTSGIYHFSFEEEEDIWIVCYESGYGWSADYAIVMKETADGFSIMGNTSFFNEKDMAVFGREEEGETRYYCLYINQKYRGRKNGMILQRFSIQRGSGEAVSAEITVEAGVWMMDNYTSVYPDYFYINEKNPLSGTVRKYVEEYLELFVYRDWKREQIWGDEEIPYPGEKEKEAILDAVGNSLFKENRYALADYDNDGEAELFYRGKREYQDIRLVRQEDGSYGQIRGNLMETREGRDLYPTQLWFAELGGKTICFQLLGDADEPNKLLMAHLCEEGRKIPILSCQVCYTHAIGLAERSSLYDSRTAPDYMFRIPLLEQEEDQENRCDELIEEKLSEETAEHFVKAGDKEPALYEGLFTLVKKDAYSVLNGGEMQYLDVYAVDLAKDTDRFQKYVDMEDYGKFYYGTVEWAYRWPSQGGEEYLVSVDSMGSGGFGWVGWYSVTKDGKVEYRDEIWRSFRGNCRQIISYEGQSYFVSEIRDYDTGALHGIGVVPLFMAGEYGETAFFWLEPQAEEYDCISLYEEEMPEALSGYVKSHFQKIAGACLAREIYPGEKEEEELTSAQLRVIKNISGGYSVGEGPNARHYYLRDVDNDGVKEYVEYINYYNDSHYGERNSVFCSVYQNIEGKFRELTLIPVAEEWENIQFWFEEIEGVTYFFTVSQYPCSNDYLLHIKVISGGRVEEKAVYLLRAGYVEVME